MSIVIKHIKAKELVEKALEKDPRCRNDDLWLILNVWRLQGINVYVDYKQLKEMFTPETITRSRRLIQNKEGRYLPIQWVFNQREENKSDLIEHYSKWKYHVA